MMKCGTLIFDSVLSANSNLQVSMPPVPSYSASKFGMFYPQILSRLTLYETSPYLNFIFLSHAL